jgi:NADH-quinone oxidoreductase subunit H
MSAWGSNLLALIVWPGLLGGTLLGWFYMWFIRKLTARLQGRKGPYFFQPFYDFVKLLGKETIVPAGINRALFYGLPIVSVGSALLALALVPVPGNPMSTFPGDLIVFIYLLEVPDLCEMLAGFATRSPYGQVGATREAMMSIVYNLPFLAAVIALAVQAGSFSLSALATTPLGWGSLVAALAFFLALPAKLKCNPFSIPNAEQELVAGAHTEFNGLPLALFELSHTLELVALIGLFATLVVSPLLAGLSAWVAFLALSFLLVILVTVLNTATARIKLNQAFTFYLRWGVVAAVLVLIVAVIR